MRTFQKAKNLPALLRFNVLAAEDKSMAPFLQELPCGWLLDGFLEQQGANQHCLYFRLLHKATSENERADLQQNCCKIPLVSHLWTSHSHQTLSKVLFHMQNHHGRPWFVTKKIWTAITRLALVTYRATRRSGGVIELGSPQWDVYNHTSEGWGTFK